MSTHSKQTPSESNELDTEAIDTDTDQQLLGLVPMFVPHVPSSGRTTSRTCKRSFRMRFFVSKLCLRNENDVAAAPRLLPRRWTASSTLWRLAKNLIMVPQHGSRHEQHRLSFFCKNFVSLCSLFLSSFYSALKKGPSVAVTVMVTVKA